MHTDINHVYHIRRLQHCCSASYRWISKRICLRVSKFFVCRWALIIAISVGSLTPGLCYQFSFVAHVEYALSL
jgi:hypothetical protein